MTYELSQRGCLQVDVQTLTLTNESAAVSSEIEDLLLADLPNGLVDGLDIVGDRRNILNRTTVRDNHVLHLIVPELELN